MDRNTLSIFFPKLNIMLPISFETDLNKMKMNQTFHTGSSKRSLLRLNISFKKTKTVFH